MKKITFLMLSIALIACDNEQEMSPKENNYFEDVASIGSMLSTSEALARIDNYQNGNPDAIQYHVYSREIIENMIQSEHVKGLKIYHALKTDNTYDLIVYGIDDSGNSIRHASSRVMEDGNGIIGNSQPCPNKCLYDDNGKIKSMASFGSFISEKVAIERISRFQELNPGGIRYNVIGKNVIQELLLNKDVEGIKIFHAKKQDNTYDLIFFGINSSGLKVEINAKTTDGSGGGGETHPCPNYCKGD